MRTKNEQDRRSVFIELNAGLVQRMMATVDGPKIQAGIVELDRSVRILANMPPRPGDERS